MVKNKNFFIYSALIVLLLIGKMFFISYTGEDPDEYRLILSGIKLVDNGVYEASRLPGYPFVELLYAAIYGITGSLNPIFYNGFVFILSIIVNLALYFKFHRIIESSKLILGLVSINFLPVMFLNSINAMDYYFAFGFVALSVGFVLNKQDKWAALFLAFAVASRLTSGGFALCLLLLMRDENNKLDLKRWVKLGVLSVVFYLPFLAVLLNAYGLGFMKYYTTTYPGPTKMYRFFLGSFGVTGILVFLYCVFDLLKNIRRTKTDAYFSFLFASFVLYTFLFFKVPLEGGYLLPLLLPMFMWLVTHKRQTVISVLIIISSLSYSSRDGGFKNILNDNLKDRKKYVAKVEGKLKKMESLSQTSEVVVVAGYLKPMIDYTVLKNNLSTKVKILYAISEEKFNELRGKTKIYVTQNAAFQSNIDVENFDLAKYKDEIEWDE